MTKRTYLVGSFVVAVIAACEVSQFAIADPPDPCECQQVCTYEYCVADYSYAQQACVCYTGSLPNAHDSFNFTGGGTSGGNLIESNPPVYFDSYTADSCECYCNEYYGCTDTPQQATCTADQLDLQDLRQWVCGFSG